MEYTLEHYKFVDKTLLPVFGFKSIIDYKTNVCLNDLDKKKDFLDLMNNLIDTIKKLFIVKEFSLHKYDGKIKTILQAIGILKKCLQLLNINYVFETHKNIKYMRLVEKNILLGEYIKTMEKMEIRDLKTNYLIEPEFILDDMVIVKKKKIDQTDVLKFVKKTNVRTFILQLDDVEEYLNIPLMELYTNSSLLSIKFNLVMKNDLHDEYIVKHTTFDSVEIMVGDKKLYGGKYTDKNILPEGLTMLPISMSKFTDYVIKLKYGRNYKPVSGNISNFVYLEMEISEIVFKKSFNELDMKQSIIFDFGNVGFYICGGVANHYEKEEIKQNEAQNTIKEIMEMKNKFESYDKLKELVDFDEYKLGSYVGVMLKEKSDGVHYKTPLAVLVMLENVDFTAEYVSIKRDVCSMEKFGDDIIYKFNLSRTADVFMINTIYIKGNVDKISNVYAIVNGSTQLTIKHNYSYGYHDGHTWINFGNDPIKLNMVYGTFGLYVYIVTKNMDIKDVTFKGEQLYFQTGHRRKLALTPNIDF
jgi:hypothetical protein